MSKFANLVVFIDGTGNNDFKKSVEEQTNVARLWHACEEVSTDEVSQNVIYKPGVGTRRGELVRGQARGGGGLILVTVLMRLCLGWIMK